MRPRVSLVPHWSIGPDTMICSARLRGHTRAGNVALQAVFDAHSGSAPAVGTFKEQMFNMVGAFLKRLKPEGVRVRARGDFVTPRAER